MVNQFSFLKQHTNRVLCFCWTVDSCYQSLVWAQSVMRWVIWVGFMLCSHHSSDLYWEKAGAAQLISRIVSSSCFCLIKCDPVGITCGLCLGGWSSNLSLETSCVDQVTRDIRSQPLPHSIQFINHWYYIIWVDDSFLCKPLNINEYIFRVSWHFGSFSLFSLCVLYVIGTID
jgi:hypothetical protein